MAEGATGSRCWVIQSLTSVGMGIALTFLVFLLAVRFPAFTYCLPGVALAWWLFPEGIMGGETVILGLFANVLVYGLVSLVILRLWNGRRRGSARSGSR